MNVELIYPLLAVDSVFAVSVAVIVYICKYLSQNGS